MYPLNLFAKSPTSFRGLGGGDFVWLRKPREGVTVAHLEMCPRQQLARKNTDHSSPATALRGLLDWCDRWARHRALEYQY